MTFAPVLWKSPLQPELGTEPDKLTAYCPRPAPDSTQQRPDYPPVYVTCDFPAITPHQDHVGDVDRRRHALAVQPAPLSREADAIEPPSRSRFCSGHSTPCPPPAVQS